jgi:uncharacterized protein (TIGR01777 family)
MANIVLTGATGYIGNALCSKLLEQGHFLWVLTRGKSDIKNGINFIHYDGFSVPTNCTALDKCDSIIHLAGLNVNSGFRWTKAIQKELIDSRTKPLEALFKYCQLNGIAPQIISAGGVSHYTDNPNGDFSESSSTTEAKNFLAHVCREWEKSAVEFRRLGCKVSIVRTSVVLEKDNAVFQKLKPVSKIPFLAMPFRGEVGFPWIALKDLINIYLLLLKKKENITCNAVAPTQYTLAEVLMKIKGSKKLLLPLPPLLLKIIFGAKSTLFLQGSSLRSNFLEAEDFDFQVKTFEDL